MKTVLVAAAFIASLVVVPPATPDTWCDAVPWWPGCPDPVAAASSH